MQKVPLNQCYMMQKTFSDYPEIKQIKYDYESYCLEEAKWHKFGRSYDCAVSLFRLDFQDKEVCELGARDSIFSSYITKFVKKIHASDNFIGWDLGNLEQWDNIWKKFSINPDKHVSEFQDMRSLSYPDNSMDIMVSFSAIEHIPGNGDIDAAREMGRVCKDGGHIVIGTDMSKNHTWNHGGYFYDEESLFDRIIKPTGCELVGDYEFSFEKSDQDKYNGIDFTSAIFVLKKGN